MNEDNQILYRRYLDNDLTEVEKSDFESRLESEGDFKQGFDIFKSMENFLDKKEALGGALDAARDYHREVREKDLGSGGNSKIRKLILGVIGTAAVMCAVYLITQNPSKEQVFEKVYAVAPWPSQRGDNSSLAEATSNYQNNQKDIAFDSLYNASTISAQDKYYWLSEVYLLENQPDSVLKYIRFVDDTSKRDRLFFLEALAYYQKDDISSLKDHLKNSPSNMHDFYQERLFILSSNID